MTWILQTYNLSIKAKASECIKLKKKTRITSRGATNKTGAIVCNNPE